MSMKIFQSNRLRSLFGKIKKYHPKRWTSKSIDLDHQAIVFLVFKLFMIIFYQKDGIANMTQRQKNSKFLKLFRKLRDSNSFFVKQNSYFIYETVADSDLVPAQEKQFKSMKKVPFYDHLVESIIKFIRLIILIPSEQFRSFTSIDITGCDEYLSDSR